MCLKSYSQFGSGVGRITALVVLFFVAGSLCWGSSWSNPLYPGKAAAEAESVPASVETSESGSTTEATAQQPSDTSSTEAAETPIVAESQLKVSETALAQKVEDAGRTVKLTKSEAEESYQVMVDQAESIGALSETINERNATIKEQDDQIDQLEHELNRWHLGIGFGAQATMDADFGAAAYLTARKGSFLLLGGVGYLPVNADWDTDRLNYQLGIVYEF